MLSYVIPTRDRPERLRATLDALADLGPHEAVGGAEVIVVDNASLEVPILPRVLRSGVPVLHIRLPRNDGAAARNEGVRAASAACEWVVMLDDDSAPTDTAFVEGLARQPADVAAVSADIWLPERPGRAPIRESGGLPEVFVGCGVALRRRTFLDLGGYDAALGYYAEEYDLAARMLLDGRRVAFDPAFVVVHAKEARHRDMDTILARLVRNNGWVAQRYAPARRRIDELRESRRRYRRIARAEEALAGYGRGLRELRATIRHQLRRPMPEALWDRFTGLAAARRTLLAAYAEAPFATAAIVDEGKNAWAVARALGELGVRLTADNDDAEALVIGTLSPGPMLDSFERRLHGRRPGARRVIMPWTPGAGLPVEPLRRAA